MGQTPRSFRLSGGDHYLGSCNSRGGHYMTRVTIPFPASHKKMFIKNIKIIVIFSTLIYTSIYIVKNKKNKKFTYLIKNRKNKK